MIVAITGGVGTGKTLILARYGLLEKMCNQFMTIFSNFHLNNYEYNKLDLVSLYTDFPELKNIIILGDELYTFMDCRMSMSKRNIMESYFIAQTRKKSVDLYFTAQYAEFVDLRLILFTDIHVSMTNIWIVVDKKFNNKIIRVKDKHPYLFNCIITDFRQPENITKTEYILDGRQWFKEYNTDQIIYPPSDYGSVNNVKKNKQ